MNPSPDEHPWRSIDLDVYERHMADPHVGQLQLLHDITRGQLADHPARTVAILGIAGGNGLDLVDPHTTTAVYGYDLNADYLAACHTRYRGTLGDRLHLIETTINRTTRLEHADLVIANLVIEYLGTDEYAAFAAANATRIGVLTSVIQNNNRTGFISPTRYTPSFDALSSIAADVDPDRLQQAMTAVGFDELRRNERHLPNGKTLIRQDFHTG